MLSYLRRNNIQIIKFILVGLISNLLNFAVYSLVYLSLSQINIASFLGYCVGLVNSFIFSRKWIFKNAKRIKIKNSFILFTFVYIVGGIEMMIMINIINYIFDNFRIAWFCGALIAASSNYLCSKYIIFKN